MICPASVPVSVELCPAQSRAIANSDRRGSAPRNDGEQLVGLLDARRPRSRARWNVAARDDQDRRVDEERGVQRRPPSRSGCTCRPSPCSPSSAADPPASAPAPSGGTGCAASPSPRGCRSRRSSVAPSAAALGHEARGDRRPTSGLARKISTRKHAPIVADQREDERLHLAHPPPLDRQQQSTSKPCRDGPMTRQPQSRRTARSSEQFRRDDRAEHLGQVARGDRDLGQSTKRTAADRAADTRRGRPGPGRAR